MWQKIYQDRQLIEITKSEYRISKSETKSNDKNSNDKNRNMACKTLSSDVVLVIETFGFRICFEFWISDLGRDLCLSETEHIAKIGDRTFETTH